MAAKQDDPTDTGNNGKGRSDHPWALRLLRSERKSAVTVQVSRLHDADDPQDAEPPKLARQCDIREVPKNMGLLRRTAENHEGHLALEAKDCLKSRMP